jgi:hypothetical protein
MTASEESLQEKRLLNTAIILPTSMPLMGGLSGNRTNDGVKKMFMYRSANLASLQLAWLVLMQ